ncbi:MAG: phospholipid scramblase-related protein [Actinomycetia bacterium]|nr:phospholipid scramblase-related protein [Actinomycetes bacterium]
MSEPSPLLTQDTVWIQQTSLDTSHFQILGVEEMVLGEVVSTDDGFTRFLAGPREFDLVDCEGTLLAHLSDPVRWFEDVYQVTGADGSVLATFRKEVTFFSGPRVSVELPDGELEIVGDFLSRDFEVRTGNRLLARASHEWSGLWEALLGQDVYQVQFDPEATLSQHLVVLASLIVMDLIRRKNRRS